jgi:hypothetical protein
MDLETLERRCPRLGGDVAFGYCMICGEKDRPCFKVFDCWWERFDVVAFLKDHLPRDIYEALSKKRTPPNKMASLVELIQQAQARAGQK